MYRRFHAHSHDSKVAAFFEKRFISKLDIYDNAIIPYLRYIELSLGEEETLKVIAEIVKENNVSKSIEVAKYLFGAGKYSEGDELLETTKFLDPNDIRIYKYEVHIHGQRGNYHKKLEALQRCLILSELEEDKLSYKKSIGETYFELEQYEEAWEYFANNFDTETDRFVTLLVAAVTASKVGDLSTSNSIYHSIADRYSFDHIKIAEEILKKFAVFDEATRLLETFSNREDPRFHRVLYKINLLQGNIELAVEDLKQAAQLNPAPSNDLKNLANLLHLLERFDESIAAYEQVPWEDLDDKSAYFFLKILSIKNRHEEAATMFLGRKKENFRIKPKNIKPGPDPTVKDLIEEAAKASSQPDIEINFLEKILPRLSYLRDTSFFARKLAFLYTQQAKWQKACETIALAFAQQNPAIIVDKARGRALRLSPDMAYAEWIENFPVNDKIFLYESSLGANTGCNPLAICLKNIERDVNKEYTHVWSIKKDAPIYPELLKHENVIFVEKGSIGHRRYLATAKYVINNSTWEYSFTKREDQVVVNTWHGVPWKTLGKDQNSEPFAYGNIARSFLQSDIMLAPDSHTSSVLTESMDIDHFVPKEAIVQMAYPRTDLSINISDDTRKRFNKFIDLKPNEKTIFYAPTWKGLFGLRDPEVEETISIAEKLAETGHKVVVRAHHYVQEGFSNLKLKTPNVYIADPSFDTNELIGLSDVTVTDFSSVLFDAAAIEKPVIKLLHDYEKYSQERGLYFEPSEVPGLNVYELCEVVQTVNEALRNPERTVGSYSNLNTYFSPNKPDGKVAEELLDMMFELKPEDEEADSTTNKVLYFSPGGMLPNGITRAGRSLLNSLHESDFISHLLVTSDSLNNADEGTISDINSYSKVQPSVGYHAGTRMEREVLLAFTQSYYKSNQLFEGFLRSGRKKEAARLFGRHKFYSAIEYSSYDSRNIALAAYGINTERGKKGIILHNEMWNEATLKYPKLKGALAILDNFDFIASVSKGVMEKNAVELHDNLGLEKSKHITLQNMIVPEEIIAKAEEPLLQEDLEWFTQKGVHVSILARLSPEKNHSTLFKAIQSVREQVENKIFFTVLGDGPLRSTLLEEIEALNLNGIVNMRGQVENPYAFLKSSDVMLLPSLYEGQPIVILESLTLGVPVIATNTAGSTSALGNGLLGTLVDPTVNGLADALVRLSEGKIDQHERFEPLAYNAAATEAFIKAIS